MTLSDIRNILLCSLFRLLFLLVYWINFFFIKKSLAYLSILLAIVLTEVVTTTETCSSCEVLDIASSTGVMDSFLNEHEDSCTALSDITETEPCRNVYCRRAIALLRVKITQLQRKVFNYINNMAIT